MRHLIITAIAATLITSPLAAEPDRRDRDEQQERSERSERTLNPYSNRAQARKRLIRDAIREADRPKRQTYRFRAARRLRPD